MLKRLQKQMEQMEGGKASSVNKGANHKSKQAMDKKDDKDRN